MFTRQCHMNGVRDKTVVAELWAAEKAKMAARLARAKEFAKTARAQVHERKRQRRARKGGD